MLKSEPGSRFDSALLSRRGKSELHMAAGSDVSRIRFGMQRRRGDPTESATENIPPRLKRGKGEKARQELTVHDGDTMVHGKPPAEQDQIWEESLRDTRRPVSSDSRVGRLDKWLPLPNFSGKTEFGLSAHSISYVDGSGSKGCHRRTPVFHDSPASVLGPTGVEIQ